MNIVQLLPIIIFIPFFTNSTLQYVQKFLLYIYVEYFMLNGKFSSRFDFDPTIRHTFWSLVIGGYITWLGNYAANQSMIQRYLTIGTLRGAQR